MTRLKIMGWLCVGLIAIPSLIPGTARPHVLHSGSVEHFFAYFVTALLFASGYGKTRQHLFVGAGLSLYSGLLELLQLLVPGRESTFRDFFISTMGAVVGIFCIRIVIAASSSGIDHLRRR